MSESSFSSALKLTDLNDFITPAQACIKPVKIDKTKGKVSAIEVDESTGEYRQVNEDGSTTSLEKTKIDLNDCLACSGCVTTAETVLVNQQSVDEFLEQIGNLQLNQKVLIVSISPQSRASIAAHFRTDVLTTLRKITSLFKKLGAIHVLDTSWSRHISLAEMCHEFVERFREKQKQSSNALPLPLLASACPGWICYAEKTHGEFVLPYISTVKSPQQVMGTIVKQYYAKRESTPADRIYHVSVMPCFDKKLEASRDDFALHEFETREVDCVLSSAEVIQLLEKTQTSFHDLPLADVDPLFTDIDSVSNQLRGVRGGSGGYLEVVLRYAAKELFNVQLPPGPLSFVAGRNADFQETSVEVDGKKVLSFALAYGFRNIQNLVRSIKGKRCTYDFVEVMACPKGCVNGGGQIRAAEGENPREHLKVVDEVYHSDPSVVLHTESLPLQPTSSAANAQSSDAQFNTVYSDFVEGGVGSENARRLFHTEYHHREKLNINPLMIKW